MKNFRLPRLPFPPDLDPEIPLHPERPLSLPVPEPTDLRHTFRCGQVFRWRQSGEWWYGPFGQSALAVRRSAGALDLRAVGAPVTARQAWRFLGLDHSLAEIYRRFQADRSLLQAARAAPGLRILRQEAWDCVAGFICSQNSNVPKIELSTERIARKWGTVHRWPEGVEVASLPRPEILAEQDPAALKETALGYRCGYLVESARAVTAGQVDLDQVRAAPYAEALDLLLQLPGIGRKVADCILLFSMDKPEAFPVDVWVRRVLHELYPRPLAVYLPDLRQRAGKPLTPREYAAMVQFAWTRWGALAGCAQMYLFHARRQGLIG